MGEGRPFIASLTLDALDDLERCLRPLTDEDGRLRLNGSNALAATAAHLAQQIDGWVCVGMAGLERNGALPSGSLRQGGDIQEASMTAVWAALGTTLVRARGWLEGATEAELDMSVPYRGSYSEWQGKRISNRLRLARIVAHIYYHIGEINTIRAALGARVEDFPNELPRLMA